MSKSSKEIYGANPDGGAAKIAGAALRLMEGKGVTTEAEKPTGKDASVTELDKNLGTAKA